MLTNKSYFISLAIFVVSFIATGIALFLPAGWIHLVLNVPAMPLQLNVRYTLFERCTDGANGGCDPFPSSSQCGRDHRESWCTEWTSAGFAQYVAFALGIVIVVANVAVLVGGIRAKKSGYAFISLLCLLQTVAQAVAVGLIVSVVSSTGDNDQDWWGGLDKLGKLASWEYAPAFYAANVGWIVSILLAIGLGVAGYRSKPSDYQEISD